MGAVPVLAGVLLLASLLRQPWSLEPPQVQVGNPVRGLRGIWFCAGELSGTSLQLTLKVQTASDL